MPYEARKGGGGGDNFPLPGVICKMGKQATDAIIFGIYIAFF